MAASGPSPTPAAWAARAAVQYDGSLGGGKVVNFGFPFETITNSVVRDAYMSDVLRFFGVLAPPSAAAAPVQPGPQHRHAHLDSQRGPQLPRSVQKQPFRFSLAEPRSDVIATNMTAFKVDSTVGAPQRFYRILLVN